MPIYCIVPTCSAVSVAGGRKMFHVLPKDPTICREWLEAIGLSHCEEDVKKKRTSYRVCSDHFDKSAYETRLVLLPTARPSLRLSQSTDRIPDAADTNRRILKILSSVGTDEKTIVLQNRIAKDQRNTVNFGKFDEKNSVPKKRFAIGRSVNIDNQITKLQVQLAEDHPDTVNLDLFDVKGNAAENNRNHTEIKINVDTQSLSDTETNSYDTNMKVQKEYLDINSECSENVKSDVYERSECDGHSEIDANFLQSGSNESNTRLNDPSHEQLWEYCDKVLGKKPFKFIKCQIILRTRNKIKGAMKFRQFCLGLYYRNPRAYSILQNFIDLPSISKLRRSYISMSAGYISPHCMKLLDLIVKKMNAKDKCCIVGVGSTRLRKHVYYDIRNDALHGLHQLDDKAVPKPANTAFVLVVKGLFTKWQLPVAYALFSDDDACALRIWTDTIIQTLIHVGFDVRAFISKHNDEDSKRACHLRNITRYKNFTVLNNKKIYHIFDVWYLIQSLRESFMSFDFKIGCDVAKWDHIVKFFDVEKELQTHLTSKLTEAHLKPELKAEAGRRGAVLAAQVFSQALATALDLFVRLRLVDAAAATTVQLISRVNDLFDLLTSNSMNHRTAYKRALTGEEWQMKFLNEVIEYFQTIKRDARGESIKDDIEAIEGFIVTMKSVENLWKDLSNDGFAYLLTRPLSIDFVDDFFLVLNSVKVRNVLPLTSIQFNRLVYKSFIEHAIKNARLQCSGGISSNMKVLQQYIAAEASEEGVEAKAVAVGEPDYKISLPKTNTIQFIAGYLMRKALDKHRSCEKLMRYLSPTKRELTETHYIDFEYFEENSVVPKELKLPVEFIAFVVKMEDRFIDVFGKERLPQRAGAAVLRAAADLILLPCPCFPLFLIKKLFVRLRMYNTLKMVNRQLKNEEIDKFEVIKLDI